METAATFLVICISILIFYTIPAQSACRPVSCHATNGPIIRFPFRLSDRQPDDCGYPGFDLYCNIHNETILKLPESGEFVVDYIDYTRQALFINDQDLCLPNRLMNFTLSGSPFQGYNLRDYTFLNCTLSWMDYSSTRGLMPMKCLSGRNYTVLARDAHQLGAPVPATCRRIADVLAPIQWAFSMFYWSAMDVREDMALVWADPPCWGCENRGGVCGYRGDSGPEIGCTMPPSSRGLSRGGKYGIIIGVGIPGLLCLIVMVCYSFGLIKALTLRRNRLNSQLPITTVTSAQRLAVRSASGLDGPTIESYPKTVLGGSRRLPKPSDATCPICLADYQPQEILRTIPDCNHYFHADCIDEWLKLNATCPLCRNSPHSSSSISISSSTSQTSDHHR